MFCKRRKILQYLSYFFVTMLAVAGAVGTLGILYIKDPTNIIFLNNHERHFYRNIDHYLAEDKASVPLRNLVKFHWDKAVILGSYSIDDLHSREQLERRYRNRYGLSIGDAWEHRPLLSRDDSAVLIFTCKGQYCGTVAIDGKKYHLHYKDELVNQEAYVEIRINSRNGKPSYEIFIRTLQ